MSTPGHPPSFSRQADPQRERRWVEVSDVAAHSADGCLIRVSRDSVQFCSGLVDLVICVGRHGGGGHCLALAGKRFVGLVAEDIAEMCDRATDFRGSRRSEVVKREPGDGGRWFLAC